MSIPVGLVIKLLRIMVEIERAPATGRNNYHGYDYVEERVLMGLLRSRFAEAGIFVFASLVEHEQNGPLTTVIMEFTFVDTENGENYSVRFGGQGFDNGDKGMYKAYSGAVKYLLLKTFMVPTGDDPEADATTDRNTRLGTVPSGMEYWQQRFVDLCKKHGFEPLKAAKEWAAFLLDAPTFRAIPQPKLRGFVADGLEKKPEAAKENFEAWMANRQQQKAG